MKPRPLPFDYAERVYAGVLGKTVGVYLGRPFEGWSHEAIMGRLGEIEGYVHERLAAPLVVADDDLSGTFTFLRALEDSKDCRAEDVAEAWLNYLIEGRTVLWWGGMGLSAEHTAYLRLKRGAMPPESGSIERNGPIVAQQIGAQIFIDGWGLVCPGDPEGAAELAKRAAVVSHDGEAVVAAQVVAAMVAAAFLAPDVDEVLDYGLSQAPPDSLIAQMGHEIRLAREEADWQEGLRRIQRDYGYEKYGGGCHVVPNHALILLALAHGRGDFDLSMKIVNTCGWDTDCNSGNVGCILGVLGGVPDRWREPVADRLLLPTADGGRCVTDCVREALAVVRMAHAMRDLPYPPPKDGARFCFAFPGSVQGFTSEDATISHANGRLRISAPGPAKATTPTFPEPQEGGYGLSASPTLYSGQHLRARVAAVGAPLRVSLLLRVYGTQDTLQDRPGPTLFVMPGPVREMEWTLPSLDGRPIAAVGFRLEGAGTLDVESLGWSGEPEASLGRTDGGSSWLRAWVDGMSELYEAGSGFRAIQNEGTGLAMTGTQEWRDVVFSAGIVPTMGASFGLAVRVQGMRRYVAALIEDGLLRLVRVVGGEGTVLAESPCPWVAGEAVEMKVAASGSRFFARCGEVKIQAEDVELTHGAVAVVVTEGRVEVHEPKVRPSDPRI